MEGNLNRDPVEKIYCPVYKHKIHCSQIEGTEASLLSEERRFEFCLNKCPVYKTHKENTKPDGPDKNCVSG